ASRFCNAPLAARSEPGGTTKPPRRGDHPPASSLRSAAVPLERGIDMKKNEQNAQRSNKGPLAARGERSEFRIVSPLAGETRRGGAS
ncbi:MAG: hypothetical protein ACR2NG_04875, partial [Acidimicrobiia bacterium]